MTIIFNIINRAYIVKRVFLFPNLPKTEQKEPILTETCSQRCLGLWCHFRGAIQKTA